MALKFNPFTGNFDFVGSTSSGSGDVVGPASATDNAVVRFDLTTGKLIQNSGVTINDANGVVSTVADTGNSIVLTLTQNDTTNNPRAVSITNAGTATTLFIDANGNASVSTSVGGAILLENTGNAGSGMVIYSNNSSPTSNANLLAIRADNTSFNQTVFRIDNDGTGRSVLINDNNSSSTNHALDIASTGSRGGLKITQSTDTGTSSSGSGAILIINTSSPGYAINAYTQHTAPTRFVKLEQASANSTTVSGAQTIDTSSTQLTVASTTGFPSSGKLLITNATSGTENGDTAYITYSSVDATHFIGSAGTFYKATASISLINAALVNLVNTTGSFSMLESIDFTTGGGGVNLKLKGPNPDLEFVALGGYDNSTGEGKYEIDVPVGDNVVENSTDVIRINGRNDANNSYDPIIAFTRPGATRQGMVGVGFQNRSTPVTLAAHLHIKNDTTFGDTNAAALIAEIVQGASGQTAALTEWRVHAGTVVASVSAAGLGTFTGANPISDDGGALGTTSLKWSDLFLASASVINFASGDVTITHSSNKLDIDGGVADFGSTPTVNGANMYFTGGTDVALADGGTGASLADPGGDRILFWDDSEGTTAWLTAGTGLAISTTTLTAGIDKRIATLFPEGSLPPATLFATFDTRAGGSTPAEAVSVLDYDDTTVEYTDWKVRMPDTYAGGDISIAIDWSATSATTGDVVWEAAIRAVPDDGEDIDGSHSYDYNAVTTTTASATGEIVTSTISFTSGADMDSWGAGETAIVRIRRNPGSGSDTMAGDAEFWEAYIKEA